MFKVKSIKVIVALYLSVMVTKCLYYQAFLLEICSRKFPNALFTADRNHFWAFKTVWLIFCWVIYFSTSVYKVSLKVHSIWMKDLAKLQNDLVLQHSQAATDRNRNRNIQNLIPRIHSDSKGIFCPLRNNSCNMCGNENDIRLGIRYWYNNLFSVIHLMDSIMSNLTFL